MIFLTSESRNTVTWVTGRDRPPVVFKSKPKNNNSPRFLIKGGKPVNGTVRLSGAKNSATKLFIAALLTDEPVEITNCPCSTIEMNITKQICETLGTKFKKFSDNEVILQTKSIKDSSFSETLGIVNRIGILTAGPLLIRTGEARIPRIGGDNIGARPIDFHIDALKKL